MLQSRSLAGQRSVNETVWPLPRICGRVSVFLRPCHPTTAYLLEVGWVHCGRCPTPFFSWRPLDVGDELEVARNDGDVARVGYSKNTFASSRPPSSTVLSDAVDDGYATTNVAFGRGRKRGERAETLTQAKRMAKIRPLHGRPRTPSMPASTTPATPTRAYSWPSARRAPTWQRKEHASSATTLRVYARWVPSQGKGGGGRSRREGLYLEVGPLPGTIEARAR